MEIFNLLGKKDISRIVNFIEKENIDINIVDDFTYSLLMKSINTGFFDFSNYLISKGANLNYQNNKGQTILHLLALNFNSITLKKALENRADVRIRDIYGNEPLWTAVFNDKGFGQRIEMIKMLLEYGANPYNTNNANISPKEFSKTAGYNDIIKILDSVPPTLK